MYNTILKIHILYNLLYKLHYLSKVWVNKFL